MGRTQQSWLSCFLLLLALLLSACDQKSAPDQGPIFVEFEERLSYTETLAEVERIKAKHPRRDNPEIRFVLTGSQQMFAFYRDNMAHMRTDRELAAISAIYPADLLTSQNLEGFAILDLGCGNGSFVKGLRELGYEAYGVDLYLEETTPFLTRHDIRELPFEKASIDRFFCTYVILKKGAYMPDFFRETVEESLRVARPGAELYLGPTTLGEETLKELLEPFLTRVSYQIRPVRPGYHDGEGFQILILRLNTGD